MTAVSDNFVRADGALGAGWATPVPNQMDFTGWGGTPQGNVLISSNGVGPDATNGLDCCCLRTGNSFGNDQYAQSTIKTVAANTATLAISAAVQAAGNTTYTYTVTQGDPTTVISGGTLFVVISGMADSGNNGFFTSTTFGAGTFTVANASGVTRAAQSGVGNCPSDCGCGVVVRGSGTSSSTITAYVFQAGTNSFGGFGETYYYELWKVVNGAGTIMMGSGAGLALSTRAVTAGDIIGISVVGTTVTAYLNGIILTGGQTSYGTGGVFQVTDSSVTSGVPGLWTFAVSGAKQYVWSLWTSGSTQFGGNNGTTVNNFMAGDISTITSQATETFKETGTYGAHDLVPYANGDLHTANANWVYEGASNFNVTSAVVYCGAGANPAFAYRSDISAPTNDQWAEVICHNTAIGGTQNYGPAVRVATAAQTAYYCALSTTNITLAKYVAGSFTSLATATAAATGDSVRITVVGTTINVYKNGALVIGPITDASTASGNVGMYGAGSASSNGFTKWAGGSITQLNTATNFIADTAEAVLLDATNGAFAGLPNATTVWTQCFENTLTWGNDQFAQATVSNITTLTAPLRGPQVRASSGGNGYALLTGSSNVELYKLVSGAATLLKQTLATTNLNSVYRIEVQGFFITCKVDGTVIIALADASIASGKPGLFWNNGGSGIQPLATLTTFSAGALASASAAGNAGSLRLRRRKRIYAI